MKIVIDPGHVEGWNPYVTGNTNEGRHMFQLAGLVCAAFTRRGVTAVNTRKSAKENPGFEARGRMAAGHDCFLSLHTNAAAPANAGRARGSEVFYSNARPNDRAMAAALSKAVSSLIGIPDRGAKLAPRGQNNPDGFGVFNGAVKANVPRMFLLECCFHDNREDCAWIVNPANMQRLADCIADTVCHLLGWRQPVPAPAPTQTNRALCPVCGR
jgi:N-acetylmuramoyl-L-alanine amidase